jgi:hypothetical protein
MENPTLPPNRVLMNWITTPDGQKAFTSQGVDVPFVQSFLKAIAPPDAVKVGPGDSLVTPTPGGMGSGDSPHYEEGYKNKKDLTPSEMNDLYTHTEILHAGDPKAAELGVNLAPGESVIAKVRQFPGESKPTLIDAKRNGANTEINLGNQAEGDIMRNNVKVRADIQKRQSAVLAAAKLGQRISDLVDQGDAKTGLIGVVSRVGAGTISQAKQLVAAAKANNEEPVSLDPATYKNQFIGNLGKFISKTGEASTRVQSNLVALAYMLARARNGGQGLSNRDVAAQLDAIGGNWLDSPTQLKAGIQESIRAAISESDGEVDITGANFKPGPDGKQLIAPPERTSDIIRKNGLNLFLTNPSKAATDAQAKAGKARSFGQMAPEDLLAVDPKTVKPNEKAAYIEALKRATQPAGPKE